MEKKRRKPVVRERRVTVRLSEKEYNRAVMLSGIYVEGESARGKLAKWCRHGILNAPAKYLK